MGKKKLGKIEKLALKFKLLPHLEEEIGPKAEKASENELTAYPPFEMWDNWVEFDSKKWPAQKVSKEYNIIPSTCFNCESACGITCLVEKETNEIVKVQGNPLHPASRGRNCAKGPATINQINDPHRIMHPLKRDGPRGSGKWKQVTWKEVIEDVSARIRKAIIENRQNEVMYHIGRPGHEGFMDWVLAAWGVDGHNSHTNICSSGARTGYALWHQYDRPGPDFANSKFILLISAHLESGHYFNPHAQRIIEAKEKGAKIAVLDSRLSNTASMANYWVPTYPGTEAAVLLAIAKIIIDEGWYNAKYLEEWVNWETYLQELHPKKEVSFENFIEALKKDYAEYTIEYAEIEAKIDGSQLHEIAKNIADAGTHFSYHNWRSASSGNLGGWQVARTLHFIAVLMGAVGTEGGTSPNSWSKFHPKTHASPKKPKQWSEILWPPEYPLTHYELGFLLPHLLKQNRGKLDVYFSRVFNPVWTHPDGFTWMEVLSDENKIGLHITMTPTWNETAYFADYVLPMGHAPERHDINSYETHAAMWMAFRQPVQREALRRKGTPVEKTFESNVGNVWEEDEFWFELSWNIDPDGSLGIRQHFESPSKKGQLITIDEYYKTIFDNIPAVVEESKKMGVDTLEYMRRVGAIEVEKNTLAKNLKEIDSKGVEIDEKSRIVSKEGKPVGLKTLDGKLVQGYPTPSRRQEIYSLTMKEWGWPEYATPGYIKSHIHWENMTKEGEICLVPTFRLPTLIHSRSGNSKWLAEISHTNPVWINPLTAKEYGVKTGDLVRVTTDIGYFVNKVWVTEGLRPGIIACSHHIGRWRREEDPINNIWAMNTVDINNSTSNWQIKHKKGVEPVLTDDPDSARIWWRDGGVHQNITFPVHPDPISGMHAWHQKVTLTKAEDGDNYGDVFVDTKKSMQVFEDWLTKTRPGPGPDNLRRPRWLKRPYPPDESMYKKK